MPSQDVICELGNTTGTRWLTFFSSFSCDQFCSPGSIRKCPGSIIFEDCFLSFGHVDCSDAAV